MSISLLRQTLRRKRRHLSIFSQRQAENAVIFHLQQLTQFKFAQHIGVYLDAFGEIRTQKIIELCFKLKKNVYLPTICNMNNHLIWVEISAQQYRNKRFFKHHFGMQQAMRSRGFQPNRLDIMILPLVACDAKGTRIGMGGGFYDRTLANYPYKPLRLGMAHDFQFVAQPLVTQKWDQALNCLITPKRVIHFKRKIA